jgi:hypothetical protein
MPDPKRHQETGEGLLHELTDDEYFAAFEEMPKVYDADGNEVTGLFDDVQDKRAEKQIAAAHGEEWTP